MRTAVLVLVAALAFAARAAAQSPPDDAEVARLAAHLDDDADMLHADYTPAVWRLCEAGARGGLAVVDGLDAANEMTRLHAERVVECVAMRWCGWTAGRGFPDSQAGDARARALLHENGDYDWHEPPAARHASMEQWRAWLTARRAQPYPPPVRPWTEQIHEGMRQAIEAARPCLTPADSSTRVTITLAQDGTVSRVVVHDVRDTRRRVCVERALRTARVPAFSGPPITFMTQVLPRGI